MNRTSIFSHNLLDSYKMILLPYPKGVLSLVQDWHQLLPGPAVDFLQ
jgi:hypothetical protein